MTDDIISLGEALPAKIKYVRTEVLDAYKSIGAAGQPAIQFVIQPAIDEGVEALASGDLPRMIRAYKALDDIQL